MKKKEKLKHAIKIVTLFHMIKNRNKIIFFCCSPPATPKIARNKIKTWTLHQNLHGTKHPAELHGTDICVSDTHWDTEDGSNGEISALSKPRRVL